MKKYGLLFILILLCAPTAPAQTRHADLGLNGRGNTASTATTPERRWFRVSPMDATHYTEGRLWYRREVTLPDGTWNAAVLELKGARFRPEVYIDGQRVSSQEGGMIRSLHDLHHESLKSGNRITPRNIARFAGRCSARQSASFIPKVDQWQEHCSSSLWDDVVLHLYADALTDRVLTDCDRKPGAQRSGYRIRGTGAASARITVTDRQKELLTRTGPALPGENEVAFDYRGLLREWSPENPTLYGLRVELLDERGETLSDCSSH